MSTKGYLTTPIGYERLDAEPLLKYEKFESYIEASNYAEHNPTAIIGQIIYVVEENIAKIYQINPDKTLSEYASKEYIDELLKNADINIDLSEYLTKVDANTTYATKNDISSKANISDLTTLNNNIEEKLSLKTDQTTFSDEITAINNKISSITGGRDDYYTKTETNDLVDNIIGNLDFDVTWEEVQDKPKINGIELVGDLTDAQLGLPSALYQGDTPPENTEKIWFDTSATPYIYEMEQEMGDNMNTPMSQKATTTELNKKANKSEIIPSSGNKANKILGFDGSGNPIYTDKSTMTQEEKDALKDEILDYIQLQYVNDKQLFISDKYINKGTTSQRPTLTQTDEGFEYYDSSLKKKILWVGESWKNLDGTDLK